MKMIGNFELARARGTRIYRRLARAIKPKVGGLTVSFRPGPKLSVIIPVYNVERYVEAAVRSVLDQSHPHVEVIVVNDGSLDSSGAIVDRLALTDARITVVHKENGGLGAARNTGIAHAGGDYIAFLDSDDLTEYDAYAVALSSLEKSGSDFAVMGYNLLFGERLKPPGRWIRDAHAIDRIGVSLAEYPEIQANVVAWSKVYRRSFFDSINLRYPEGILWEDQEPASMSYARASSIDILSKPIVRWRMRDEGTSITQQSADLRNLRDRFTVVERSLAILRRYGQEDAYIERLLQVLSSGTFTLGNVLNGDPGYWTTLREGLQRIWGRVPRELIIRRLSAQDRVMYHLILANEQASAIDFVRSGCRDIRNWIVEEDQDGLLYGRTPAWTPPVDAVPRWALRILAWQAAPQVMVESWRWINDEALEIVGSAYFAGVNPDDAELELLLRGIDSHIEIGLQYERYKSDTAGRLTGHRYLQYNNSVFKTVVSARELIPLIAPVDQDYMELQFLARLSGHGLVETRPVGNTWGPRNRDPQVSVPVEGRAMMDVKYDDGFGVCVRIRKGTALTVKEILIRDRKVTISWDSEQRFNPVEALIVHPTASVKTRIEPSPRGSVDLVVPRWRDGSHLATRVKLRDSSGVVKSLRIGAETQIVESEGAELVTMRGNFSQPFFFEGYNQAFVSAVSTADNAVRIELEILGLPEDLSVTLIGPRDEIFGELSQIAENRVSVLFNCETDAEQGWLSTLVQPGNYKLNVIRSGGKDGQYHDLRVQWSPKFGDSLPVRNLGDGNLRVDVNRSGSRGVSLNFSTSGDRLLAHPREMKGRIENYLNRSDRVEEVLYLQCLRGDQVNDTQLALALEYSKRESRPRIIWGVENGSVRVPLGQESVIINSDRYFDVLGSARVLCFNHEVPNYLRKGPRQTVLQTYHGHPFKMMGLSRFRALNYSVLKTEHSLDWRRHWDLLLSPSPDATQLYKENYPIDVDILEIGHPRNDRLAKSGERERAAARRRLGVRPGVKVILYAPTWRDYEAKSPWASEMVKFLNPSELGEALGPEYVLLQRGHPAHGRGNYDVVNGSQVIDVTYHPDINDLILAADVGVFDYSSIRFDFAVTGKPMVFFVPDKQAFFETAPPLMPFDETTPGPQVATVDELCETLERIDSVADEYSASYREFRARFSARDDGSAAARLADELGARLGGVFDG